MTDDVLDALEEEYATTIRLALLRAASDVSELEEPVRLEDPPYVTLTAPRVDSRRRRHRPLVNAAAILVFAASATIVVVQTRQSSVVKHSAAEIAPGWTLSRPSSIGSRAGAVLLSMGTDVMIWGGAPYEKNGSIGSAVRDGVVYDSATDEWTIVGDAPIAPRFSAKASWTGSVALIWGGLDDAGRSLDDGAIFDPSTSTWGTIPVAPAGVSGTGSAVVWTGTEMIVWGGPNGSTGAAFNPTTNRWRVLPTAPIASPQLNSGVWTDTEVIVWANGQGAAYNPVIDTWRTISVSPLRPATPHGIWTGSEVVFLGGASDDNGLTESAAYQPTSDTWRLLAPGPAHPGLGFQWTGTTILAVVKGVVLQYDLTTDQWTEKTAPLPAQPFGSWTGHSYIFTTATNTSDLRIGAYTPNDITHAAPVSAYNLALPTARLTNDETSTARGTDVAVWTHDDGTYLTLTMIPIEPGGPVGVGTTTKIATFPTDRGQAWYGEQELPSAADGTAVSSLLWWQRPDGVVWLINAYWYGKSPPTDTAQRQQRFVEWALDITTPTEGTYQLSDPGITPIAAERAGDRRSRVRIWNYDNQQIIILVIEDAAASGLASALAKGRPERIYVDTHRGWTTGTSDIPVTIAWQVNDLTKEWATMTIPAALADKTAEIVHDVQSAG